MKTTEQIFAMTPLALRRMVAHLQVKLATAAVERSAHTAGWSKTQRDLHDAKRIKREVYKRTDDE